MKIQYLCCPLCRNNKLVLLFSDKFRDYRKCNTCGLVFVPPEFRLSESMEKERYDFHKNSPSDPNYRKFLSKLFIPFQKYLSPYSKGLDFGSGPGPALSLMFEEKGHSMKIYDYYYANDRSVYNDTYDFITATEVLEHLSSPLIELNKLWNCLKPSSHLGIMTKLLSEKNVFDDWYYKNDPTHVSFFSKDTFEWIGRQWHSKPIFIGDDVIIFTKTIDCKNNII